tara:strand:- start:4750 stop:5499 length:750 start_codon:yes stop_codon:yes gene_type:complete
MRKIRVVIPLYNEVASLPTLIYRIKGVQKILKDDFDFGYIIINDGSTDKTLEKLQSFLENSKFVIILNHNANKGFGAALKTGIRKALEVDSDIIVTIDGDTNYDHFLIPQLVSELTDDIDIVTASPWHPEGGRKQFPKHRLLFSLVLSWLYRFVIGKKYQNLYCYSAGFRCYKKEVLDKVNFTGNDFLATAEIIIRSILKGFKVKEYPVHVAPRWYGISKMQYYKQTVVHLKFIYWLYYHIKEIETNEA